MLIISDVYDKQNGPFGKSYFDIIAESQEELQRFFGIAKTALGRLALDEEVEITRIAIPYERLDRVQSLVYRHNLELRGMVEVAEKKEYLDHFSLEAVKAIIYSTDFIPAEMTIDQYASIVITARAEYGDSSLFQERLLNVAVVCNHVQMKALALQIELFIALFNVPFESFLGEVVL